MATARLVVNTALRKLGVLASGREPRLSDQTDAFDALRGLYGSWIASGAFGRLRDVVAQHDYCALPNDHVYRQSEALQRVILPGLTWCHNFTTNDVDPILDGDGEAIMDESGRDIFAEPIAQSATFEHRKPPRDGSVVRISDEVGGETRTWLYDGTTKRWQALELLSLDDEAPRSDADMQGLASTLAIEIADQFDATILEATVRQAQRFQLQMTGRFGVGRECVTGVYY